MSRGAINHLDNRRAPLQKEPVTIRPHAWYSMYTYVQSTILRGIVHALRTYNALGCVDTKWVGKNDVDSFQYLIMGFC